MSLAMSAFPKGILEIVPPRLIVPEKGPSVRWRTQGKPSMPSRIAVIGNHLPRQCGIATFTTDLCDAISTEFGASGVQVVAVNDARSKYIYPTRVRSEITESDLSSYRATAERLNACDVDLVCLQHEYGIFGGKAG